jgi:hypothetical protein
MLIALGAFAAIGGQCSIGDPYLPKSGEALIRPLTDH